MFGLAALAVGQTYTIKTVAGIVPTPTSLNPAPNNLFLYSPLAALTGPDGSVYMADTANHKVWVINPSGSLSVLIGSGISGTPTDGKVANTQNIGEPSGLAMDPSGNLYVADQTQHKIYKIDTTQVVTTLTLPSRLPGTRVPSTLRTPAITGFARSAR